MKLTGLMKATFVGVLAIGVLSSNTAAQDTPQEPKKEMHLVTASTPREQQIELALSAAPTEVSSKATIYILGAKGYERAREGTNGFSCLIDVHSEGERKTRQRRHAST
jgi:hypothetical protein